MNEELKIKVKADTSQAVSALTGLKTSLLGMGKTSSSSSKDVNQIAYTVNNLTNAVKGLNTNLKASAATIATTMGASLKLGQAFRKSGEDAKMSGRHVKHLAQNWSEMMGQYKNRGGLGQAMEDYRDYSKRMVTFREDLLKALGPYKEFSEEGKKVKAELKELNPWIEQYASGIRGVYGSVNRLVGRQKDLLKNLAFMLASLTAIVTILPALIGLVASIKIAKLGDEIKDNAAKMMMSTTAYQEWGYVLKQNGLDISNMTTQMRTFNKHLASGDSVLGKYGITATDTDTALNQAVSSIQNLDSEQAKLNATLELFGNRASDLMPVMMMTNQETRNLMNTYRAIGGTMSNELIAKSDVLADSITALKASFRGLLNTLAESFMPFITKLVQGLTILIAKISIVIRAILNLKATFGGKSTSSGGGLAGSTGAVASNMGSAAKSAKEIRRTLAGFDELELLSNRDQSGGSGGGGGGAAGDYGGGFGGGFLDDDQLTNIEEFRKRIEDIKKALQILVPLATLVAGLILIGTGHFVAGAALVGISIGIAKQGIFSSISDSAKEAIHDVAMLAAAVLIAAGILTANPIFALAGIGALAVSWAAAGTSEKQNNKKKEKQNQKTTAGAGSKVQFNSPTVQAKYENITQTVTQKWETSKDSVRQMVSDFKSTLKSAGGKVGGWILNVIEGAGTLVSNIRVGIASTWSSLKATWENLMSNFKDKVVSVKLNISATVSNIKTFINDHIITPINNKIHSIGILKNVSIPKLAGGGVLTSPTVAMMGEYAGAKQNPEIVAPQKMLMETMNAANDNMITAFAQMTKQVIKAIEDNETQIVIGDETIAKSAQRGNQSYRNRTGKPLITT